MYYLKLSFLNSFRFIVELLSNRIKIINLKNKDEVLKKWVTSMTMKKKKKRFKD